MIGTILKFGVSGNIDCELNASNDFSNDHFKINNFEIRRNINLKFFDDKVFSFQRNIFVSIDGVILNLKQLKKEFLAKSNFDLILKLYERYGELFIRELRGDFSLILFDVNQKKLLVYTNITSTKPIYYCKNNFVSSNPAILLKILQKNNISLSPNIDSFYAAAGCSYLIGEHNYCNEIKKLTPGKYLCINESEIKEKQYHILSPFPINHSKKNEILKELNDRLCYATELQYEKDKEYGYKHLVTLSGGLDSRITALLGNHLGYNINTITFSSKGHWEKIIADSICKKYKLKSLLCKKIDSGYFLKDFERLFNIDGGVVSFYVAAQMIDLYNDLNFKKYGMIHSGQFGSVLNGWCLGPLNNKPYHYRYGPIIGMKYEKNYDKIEPSLLKEMIKYDSLEITQFYNHVFNGTIKGSQIMYNYTESCSPFTFNEVFDFCLKINPDDRKNHKLYLDWMKKYHPEFGSFYYDFTGRRTLRYSNNKYINKCNHLMNLTKFKIKGLKIKNNEWINYNKWVNDITYMKKFNSFFYDKIDIINDNELRKNLINQYETGNFEQKMCSLNCVIVYNNYF